MNEGKIWIALNNSIAGGGKDTIADFLVDNFDFKKYSLSEWIYEVAWNVYGVERGTKPPRKLLHHIGESLREYDKLVWIKKTMRKILAEGHDKVVITDVRKGLEHFYLKEHGFINVKVYCDKRIAIERMKERDNVEKVDAEILKSNLETEVEPLRMPIINNSGDWKKTVEQIDELISEITNQSFY